MQNILCNLDIRKASPSCGIVHGALNAPGAQRTLYRSYTHAGVVCLSLEGARLSWNPFVDVCGQGYDQMERILQS